MLKLVVDNKEVSNMDSNLITCRNSCDLFDDITETCSIKMKVNVDSPYEVSRCGKFMSKGSLFMEPSTSSNFNFSLMGESEEYILDDEAIFHEIRGNKFDSSKSTYPLKADYPSKREDATWYVSPCGTFACWLINHYQKPLSIPKNKEEAEKGWDRRVYRSPIPLHDHKTSLSLASRMAWFVDEEGYGQYTQLINGEISTITSPKPDKWRRKY